MKKKDLKIGDCVAIGKPLRGVVSYETKKAYIIATHAKITKDSFDRMNVESLTGGRYILAAVSSTHAVNTKPHEFIWFPAHISSASILCTWEEARRQFAEREEHRLQQLEEGQRRLIKEADQYAEVRQKLKAIGSQWLPIETHFKNTISIPTETLLKILNHTLPLTK